MERREFVGGAELKRARLICTEEEAEQLAAYLTELREVRARLSGERPLPRPVIVPLPVYLGAPFQRALPRLTLRMWRTSFDELRALPALRNAGITLIEELERAYAHLDPVE